ncbi:MAG: tRNA dihydrouridine synthase DusB [Clostridia bacterium]|nr:tRNA dihydrouridine synthase DusB [Clostridia bacterium]
MKIGNIEIPNGAGLAPMAGVTDAAMRLLCYEMGAGWAVSEMLSAKGWIYSQGKNKNAVELLTRLPGEGLAGLQLFGSEPEYIAQAARQLSDIGFSFIDLNFGCPAPKITGNGEGSALMKTPERIGEIVRTLVEAVELPVTVKIRAGWDETCINAPEVAKICEQAGAVAIAVHGRTRMQQYAGEADWSVIKAVKDAVSVPVIGNGDVRSGEDALRMVRETGCDSVMVGRAAQGNPWIFGEIKAALIGADWQPPTPADRIDMALRHFDLETEIHGANRGLLEMRKHIAWYVQGLSGANRFRTTLNGLKTAEEVKAALKDYLEHLS